MKKKDYYQILYIRETASQEEIRRAYRRLAKKFHADLNREVVPEEREFYENALKEVNEAFKVLSNSQTREEYDRQRREKSRPAREPPPIPRVRPTELNFGILQKGEKETARLQIDNLGGPAHRLNITLSKRDSWFSIELEGDEFPISAKVEVDTKSLEADQSYHGWIEFDLDGATERIQLKLSVLPVHGSVSTSSTPTTVVDPKKTKPKDRNNKRIASIMGIVTIIVIASVFTFKALAPSKPTEVPPTASRANGSLATEPAQILIYDWELVGFEDVNITGFASPNASTIYVATHDDRGIFKSLDSGNTWTAINNGLGDLDVVALELFPGATDKLLSTTYGDIWKTEDGGNTWTLLIKLGHSTTTRPSGAVAFVSIDGQEILSDNGKGLIRSVDAGLTWQENRDVDCRKIRSAPSDRKIVYCVDWPQDPPLRSDDGGATWQHIASPGHQGTELWDLSINPQDPNQVFACTSHGVYKSTNGGWSWTLTNNSLATEGEKLNCTALLADPNRVNTVYAAYEGYDPWWTQNSGKNWEVMGNNPEIMGDIPYSLNLGAPIVSFGVVEDYLLAGTNFNGVFRLKIPHNKTQTEGSKGETQNAESSPSTSESTQPASDHWQSIGLPEETVSSFTFADGGNIFASTLQNYHGVFKSQDGGLNWSSANSGLGNLDVINVEVAPDGSGRLYAITSLYLTQDFYTGEGIWQSNDNGSSWTQLIDLNGIYGGSTPSGAFAISPLGGMTIYADTGRGLTSSGDGGISWAENREADCWEVYYAPTNPSALYCVKHYEQYRSSDAGASWQELNVIGHMGVDVFGLSISTQSEDVVYACTSEGIYKTTDGGWSWVPTNNSLPNQGQKLKCTATLMDPNRANTVYAAFEGQGPWWTQDGGATWETIGGNWDPNITIISLGANESILYAGTFRGGVWRIALSR